MRKIEILLNAKPVGELHQHSSNDYSFIYNDNYDGQPISRTMPLIRKQFNYERFPPFFDGLLPEGPQLNYLLKSKKIDENDYISQLLAIGDDFVGAVSVKEIR